MIDVDREQELAKIKCSNELLEECKQKVLDNSKLDEKSKKDRIAEIDVAIEENYKKAKTQYQATRKEVDSSKYRPVSEEYKEKYAERLQKKGLTDEQLHQKEQAVVLVATGEETTPVRKRHRRTKRTEQLDDESGFDASKIERISNEEELMKKSHLKDEKDFERRRHRSSDTMSDTPFNKTHEDVVGTVIEAKKVKPRQESSTKVSVDGEKTKRRTETKRILEKSGKENSDYNFDLNSIPSYVQYDILPLPSNGECYAHKKNRIPVAYLTAADENIIASPNMYRDGKIIDVILGRKILDKDINPEELCRGDRDAIVLWLRATGYGTDFPIVARHPDTGKQYPINVKLDTFKYYPFNLKGDENGWFEYTTESGDVLKFKYLSAKEEDEARDEIIAMTTDIEKFSTVKTLKNLRSSVSNMDIEEDDKKELNACIEDMKDVLKIDDLEFDSDNIFSNAITNQMVKYTMSVNGNEDKEFVRGFIENMRAKDAFAYRTFVNDNTPGVNMKISVNVPQSDGGGTFDTFLGIDDYVFGNI
jgi:hypothetical protein